MKIELRLFASLARHMPPQKTLDAPEMREVAEGATVRRVLEDLNVPLDSVKVVFLNGIHAGMDVVLREGDRVGVFPPVAGG